MEEANLEQEYVQEFVLDHLEDVVKRENRSSASDDPNNNEEEREVPVPTSTATRLPLSGQLPATPHPQLLTPPTGSGDEQVFPHESGPLGLHHPALRMTYSPRPEMIPYPGSPGTPPDTPPGRHSPRTPENPPYHLDSLGQPPNLLPLPKPELVDTWIPNPPLRKILRQEPLDLRPHCAADTMDWSIGQNHPSVIAANKRMHHSPYPDYEEMAYHNHKRMRPPDFHQHDMDSMSPGTPLGPIMGHRFDQMVLSDGDSVLDDEILTTLTVRDLNKKLHGYPREVVAKLKQKRRTLKNRGYAQNCRSKRIQQKQDLESTNTTLRREIERLKNEIQMLKMELHRSGEHRDMKDMYHHQQHQQQAAQQRCEEEMLRRGHDGEWGL